MNVFTHRREVWSPAECAKRARAGGRDYFGTKQRPGLIAGSASVYPQYGQTVRFNGGTIGPDGKHYDAVSKPLPIIPRTYRFEKVLHWGTYIVRNK